MVFDPRAERLARELKSLVGHGAQPKMLTSERCPVLYELVASRYQDLDPTLIPHAAIHELREAATCLAPDEAASIRELLKLTRRYQGTDAVVRRENVIDRLQVYCAVETWRGEPELDFLRDFADFLLGYLTAT